MVNDQESSDEEDVVWRQRWDSCDQCGCSTAVTNEDSPDGVPAVEDWDRTGCMVCGSRLTMGNADEITSAQEEHERRRDLAGEVRQLRANLANVLALCDTADEAALRPPLVDYEPIPIPWTRAVRIAASAAAPAAGDGS